MNFYMQSVFLQPPKADLHLKLHVWFSDNSSGKANDGNISDHILLLLRARVSSFQIINMFLRFQSFTYGIDNEPAFLIQSSRNRICSSV